MHNSKASLESEPKIKTHVSRRATVFPKCPFLRLLVFLGMTGLAQAFQSTSSLGFSVHPVFTSRNNHRESLHCSNPQLRGRRSSVLAASPVVKGLWNRPPITCWDAGSSVGASSKIRSYASATLVSSANTVVVTPQPKPILILGGGWVGSRLAVHLEEQGQGVVVTNREPSELHKKPAYFKPVPLPDQVPTLQFDLSKPETWSGLPAPEDVGGVVLTFALEPLNLHAFWEAYLQHTPHVVAYSSTSVYKVQHPGETVDEKTELVGEHPRAQAEEWLRGKGGVVLTLGGIYGESRGMRGLCTCLRLYTSGEVPPSGHKVVNMIHVQDIIQATTRLLQQPQIHWQGERVNAAGKPYVLNDLVGLCKGDRLSDSPPDMTSKHVQSRKLLVAMPTGFDFHDFGNERDEAGAPLDWRSIEDQ